MHLAIFFGFTKTKHTNQGFWNWKYRPVEVIEAVSRVPGKFEMLSLIFADWDMGGSDQSFSKILIQSHDHIPMDQNIGSLKNGIRE